MNPSDKGVASELLGGEGMNFRGGIRLPEDRIERDLHARLTIDEAADQITIAAEDDFVLGKWQPAEVVVESLGDLDFVLTRSKDQLVFRPDGPAGYTAFANATTPPTNSAFRQCPDSSAHTFIS